MRIYKSFIFVMVFFVLFSYSRVFSCGEEIESSNHQSQDDSVNVANIEELEGAIVDAKVDTVLKLTGNEYVFERQIPNNENIKITIIGTVNSNGKPDVKFRLKDDFNLSDSRFIVKEKGTLSLKNIELIGNPSVTESDSSGKIKITKQGSGGILVIGDGGNDKNISFLAENCIFRDNHKQGGGGAIAVKRGVNLDLNNCEFYNNSSTADGGAIGDNDTNGGDFLKVSINKCTFQSNFIVVDGKFYGGAISIKLPAKDASISISKSIFIENNNYSSYGFGGAIHVLSPLNDNIKLEIDECLFKDNYCKKNGGALAFTWAKNIYITDCTFLENKADGHGGAIFIIDSNQRNNNIINSTFVKNSKGLIRKGQAICSYNSNISVDSSTLISNDINYAYDNIYYHKSIIDIRDSVITDVTMPAAEGVGNNKINYLGYNLVRKTSADNSYSKEDLFTNYSPDSLIKISESNYVAPVKYGSLAYKMIVTIDNINPGNSRLTQTSQNKKDRKAISDVGAYEAPQAYKVSGKIEGSGGSFSSDNEFWVTENIQDAMTENEKTVTANFTVVPDSGFIISEVKVNDTSQGKAVIKINENNSIVISNVKDGDIEFTVKMVEGYRVKGSVVGGNGTLDNDSLAVAKGKDAKFTVSPKEGFALDKVIVTGGTALAKVTGNTILFENVTSDIVFEVLMKSTGGDRPGGGGSGGSSKPKEEIKYHKAYINGYPDKTFRGDSNMTRAEVAQMLYNIEDNKLKEKDIKIKFNDIDAKEWYYDAVASLTSKNILNGYSDGSFRPYEKITRAEYTALVVRFNRISQMGELDYKDVSLNHWAYKYIASANAQGYIKGYSDGTFKPEESITRSEVVTLTNRSLNREAHKDMFKYLSQEQALEVYADLKNSYWAYLDIMEASISHDYKTKDNKDYWEKIITPK